MAFVEEFYGLIQEMYEKEFLHAVTRRHLTCHGNIRLENSLKISNVDNGYCVQLHSMYHGIPRSAVEKFVSMCPSCQLRKPQVSSGPLRPIIAHGSFCRLQVYVILQVRNADKDCILL